MKKPKSKVNLPKKEKNKKKRSNFCLSLIIIIYESLKIKKEVNI